MQQDPNYGSPQEEPRLRRVPMGGGMSAQDERTWSMIAHLSVLLSLVTGIGGPIAALVIWLVYKDRSQGVAFHALQSLWYQVAWAVILFVGWSITFILMFVLIGFLLVPVMAIASLVPSVHRCSPAYKSSKGVVSRNPVIANMVKGGGRAAKGYHS